MYTEEFDSKQSLFYYLCEYVTILLIIKEHCIIILEFYKNNIYLRF